MIGSIAPVYAPRRVQEHHRQRLSSGPGDALLINIIQYRHSCHNNGAMRSHHHVGARSNRHDPKKSTALIPIYFLHMLPAKCHQYTPNSLAAKREGISDCEVTTHEVGSRTSEGLTWPKDVTFKAGTSPEKAVLSRGFFDGPGDHQSVNLPISWLCYGNPCVQD